MKRTVLFSRQIDDLVGVAKAVERICDIALRKKGLSMGMFAVLKAVGAATPRVVSPSELLQSLAVTQPTLSCHLSKLRTRKLIKTSLIPGEKDARMKGILLTPDGFGLLNEISDYWIPYIPFTGPFEKELAEARAWIEKHLADLKRRRAPVPRVPASPEITPMEEDFTDLFEIH